MVKNGLKICSRDSGGTPGPVSSIAMPTPERPPEVSGAMEMLSTRSRPSGEAVHRLECILNQIDEDALAKLLVGEYFGQPAE